MNFRLNNTPTCLAKNRMMMLTDAKESRISCRSGGLWITQDNDLRDIVLAPGDSFIFDAGDPVLVSALVDSSFDLMPAYRSGLLGAALRRWGGGVREVASKRQARSSCNESNRPVAFGVENRSCAR